jgi:hypothetical protein
MAAASRRAGDFSDAALLLHRQTARNIIMSGTQDWFSTFVGELETAATAAWTKIEPIVAKIEDEIFTAAPDVIGKMAQIAVNTVSAQFGVNLPGEGKFGQAVTSYIQQVEADLGFTPKVQDAHAAVQAAYTKVVSKAKGN